ncbi:MAG: lipopolysaccharide biosynthesis protein [Deltaproteobacteria bacterium]|nr:lipopolysaccharide biosynthesis protein [Deltaproteobacteria bacterium]
MDLDNTPHDSGLRQRVLSGLRWSAGARFLAQLITWAITIIVVRLLTPDDYGLMALAMVFIGFLTMLNEMGFGAAIIQMRDMDTATLQNIFGFLLMANFLLFLTTLTTAPLIAAFFDEHRLESILRVLSVQFMVIPFGVIPQSLIDRDMLFSKRAIIELTASLTGSVMTLLLALNGFGVWALIWGSLSLSMCRTVGLNMVCPYFSTPRLSFQNMRNVISFGGYVTLTRIIWFCFVQADIFIVGKILGKERLGYYSVAKNLASLPMDKIAGIINQVALPAFSEVQSDPQWSAALCLKGVRVMSFLAFPILWGISSVGHELIAIFLGPRWYTAAIPFQLMALVVPLRMVANLLEPAVLGIGRPEISFYNVLFAFGIMGPCIAIATHWGIVGVSVTWVTVYPLVITRNFSRIATALNIRFRDLLLAMAKPAFAASLMYASVMAVKGLFGFDADSVASLVMLVIVGSAVYSLFLLTLHREGCREVLELIH